MREKIQHYRAVSRICINVSFYLNTASKEMTIVPISQPAFPNALGIANAPVPTIKLNKNTRPTYKIKVNRYLHRTQVPLGDVTDSINHIVKPWTEAGSHTDDGSLKQAGGQSNCTYTTRVPVTSQVLHTPGRFKYRSYITGIQRASDDITCIAHLVEVLNMASANQPEYPVNYRKLYDFKFKLDTVDYTEFDMF